MKRLIRTRHWYIDEFKDIIRQAKCDRFAKWEAFFGALFGAGLGLLYVSSRPAEVQGWAILYAASLAGTLLAKRRMTRWARRADYVEACLRAKAAELKSRQQRFRADDFRMGETLLDVCDDWGFSTLCFKERVTSAGRVEYCCQEKRHAGGCVWVLL